MLRLLFLRLRLSQGHDDLSSESDWNRAISLQSWGVYRRRSEPPSDMSLIRIRRPRTRSWPGTAWNLPIERCRSYVDPRDILPIPRRLEDDGLTPEQRKWDMRRHLHAWLEQLVRNNGHEAVFGPNASPPSSSTGTNSAASETVAPSGTDSRPQTATMATGAQYGLGPRTTSTVSTDHHSQYGLGPRTTSTVSIAHSNPGPRTATTRRRAQFILGPRTNSTVSIAQPIPGPQTASSATLHQPNSMSQTATTATISQPPLPGTSTQPPKRKEPMSMSLAGDDVAIPSIETDTEGLPSR